MLAGRYRLDEQIAAGGGGEVWRALDVVLERPVAVKLLRAEHAGNPEAVERFRAEARYVGSVSHPGIAQVHDYGDADPPHPAYLVMELVDGESLAELLARGPLAPARAMDVLAQAAAGLHAAHLAGLVHRDIKPGNLLIARDGRVKITDFGIAQLAGSSSVAGAGMLVGTPAYLAPELIAGARATPASDLYSLGIVGYECLVGWPPFSGVPVEVAFAHRERPLPPLPASLPPEVAGLVADLTAKDEAARPCGADEVASRAGRIRDCMADGAALPRGGLGLSRGGTELSRGGAVLRRGGAVLRRGERPDPLATTQTDLPPRALRAAQPRLPGSDRMPGSGRGLGRLRRGLAGLRPGRLVLLAGIAVAVASLLGLVLAGALSSRQLAAPPSRARQPAASAVAAVRTAEVNGQLLAGQPVSVAQLQLRQLGLRVRVLWQPSDDQLTGTVLFVQPGGRARIGSLITVIGAVQAQDVGRVNGHGRGGPGDGHHGGGGGGEGGGGGGNGGGGNGGGGGGGGSD
jgi:eukaryotic-like serine/threonine-protein kinase